MGNEETPGAGTPRDKDYFSITQAVEYMMRSFNGWDSDFENSELRSVARESSRWQPTLRQQKAIAWHSEQRRRYEAYKAEMLYTLVMRARLLVKTFRNRKC